MTGDEAIKALLAEAERRGAERGWDEGWGWGMSDADSDGADTPNPYRKPSSAGLPAQEPVQQSGIRVRPYVKGE